MTQKLRTFCPVALILGLVMHLSETGGMASAFAALDDEVFKKLDTNEDGVLSGTEAATVRQFDGDNDGEVTKAEYQAGMAAELKRLLEINDDKLFADRDANEDGSLSGKELRGLEKYDTDRDGDVTREEFDQGRAADRRKLAPNPQELAKQALEKFRQLDINEDGRLSGKEIQGFEKLDRDGDRRITEKEFIAGFTGSEAPADPVTVFLEMVRTVDPVRFLAAADPEFAAEIDRPVLQFVLNELNKSLGTLQPAAKGALKKGGTEENRTLYQGTLPFKDGTAEANLIVANGKIVGFSIQSPVLNDVGDRLYSALFEDPKFAKSTAEYYTPRCSEFIRLILAGDDDKAFSKYHPEVQKQLGRKKVQDVFDVFKAKCGKPRAIELEAMRIEFDENMKGEKYKLTHLVRGTNQDYFATTSMQFIGLSAHIVGLTIEPAEGIPETLPNPNDKEGKWTTIKADKEGLSFDLPGPPKQTVDEENNRIVYRHTAADESYFWTVLIETLPENFEAKADALFAEMKKIIINDTKGKLIDEDASNLGTHPGRILFLTVDNVFYAERMVVVGSKVLRFQVVTTEADKRAREKQVNRYFESVKLLDALPPVVPPAPPAPTVKPPVPAPPRLPALPKPPVP